MNVNYTDQYSGLGNRLVAAVESVYFMFVTEKRPSWLGTWCSEHYKLYCESEEKQARGADPVAPLPQDFPEGSVSLRVVLFPLGSWWIEVGKGLAFSEMG